MPRLFSSLAAAAAVLADQAADRLDTWVENNTDAEAPRETPIGFTVPTDVTVKGVDVKGLTGEQRARWLAEVKGRLDASTGGPWCTEERENPTGRIISPYGVIATGVTREADRDLIEDARADLFGLLALAEYDDQVIEALQYAARHQTERRNVAERELAGMYEREAAVDQVQRLNDALHVANSNNASMKQELDRARALLEAAQQDGSASHLEVSAVMGAYERGLTLTDIDVREDSLAERVLAALIVERDRASDLERKLDAHHRHDSADGDEPGLFMAAGPARQLVHTIKVAMDMYDNGHDPMTLTLHHPLDLAGRVAGVLSTSLRERNADGAVDRCDRDAHTDADAVRARAAERILAFAAEELPKVNDTYGTVYISGLETAAALIVDTAMSERKMLTEESDTGAGAAMRIRQTADDAEAIVAPELTDAETNEFAHYLAGMREAARIAANELAAADPDVAHIDTVNGRAEARLVEPGSVVEAVLNNGGTVAIDDAGEPHIVATPLVPLGPGTLVTADGKWHRFTSGTAQTVDHDVALGIMQNIKDYESERDTHQADDEDTEPDER
jgi:hypothetical protein